METSHRSVQYSTEIEILEDENLRRPKMRKYSLRLLFKNDRSQFVLKVLLAILLLCIVAFLMVGMFFFGYFSRDDMFVNQSDFVYYDPNEYRLNRTEGSREAPIMETREFQTKLDRDLYGDRWAGVNDLKNFLREYMNEDLPDSNWKTTIYSELQVDTSECGFQFSELRKRDVNNEFGFPVDGKSTIDINVDEGEKEKALEWDLTSSEEYNSEMKIEQDIHIHNHKFNIKTKVKSLDRSFALETCQDVQEMFPHAFDSVERFNSSGVLGVTKHPGFAYYVWQHAYSDDFFFGTAKLKLSWTLYFDSLTSALNVYKLPSVDSEFSIRIYSPGDGYAPWHYEALEYAADIFRAVEGL